MAYRRAIGACIVLSCVVIPVRLGASEASVDPTAERKRVAIISFNANNVPTAHANIVRNLVEVALYSSNAFNLVEWEQVQKVMKSYGRDTIANTDMKSSLELGRLLATDYLVVGSVDKIDEYRVTIRVVSIREKKIIIAYSRAYGSETGTEAVVEKMARDTARDLQKYIRTGSIEGRFYDHHRILLGVEANYLYPAGRFYDLVNAGPGIALQGVIEHVFIDNLVMGVGASYSRLSGKENANDSITIMSLSFPVSYRFYPQKRFFLGPIISPGLAFLTIAHGEGAGFNMRDNYTDNFIEPICAGGGVIGVLPTDHLTVQFSAQYGFIYEREGVFQFYMYCLGVFFSF